MEKFALTNLINTNKPKGRPSSLANGIRQCHAWKRRDGSCWPFASFAAAQQHGGDLRHDRAPRSLAPNGPRA
jgi:hypothetical protein